MHTNQHFHENINEQLRPRFPGGGNERKDATRSFHGNQDQQKMSEDGESERRPASFQPEERLDFRFKHLGMIAQLAGTYAPQFPINAIQISKDNQDRT